MALISVPMGARNYANKETAIKAVENKHQDAARVDGARMDYMLVVQYGRVYPVLVPTEAQVNEAIQSPFYAIRR
jgi:hypothetical protein